MLASRLRFRAIATLRPSPPTEQAPLEPWSEEGPSASDFCNVLTPGEQHLSTGFGLAGGSPQRNVHMRLFRAANVVDLHMLRSRDRAIALESSRRMSRLASRRVACDVVS